MGNEIYPEYRQLYLLPPSLEDFVPEDHPARFIREFVDSLDLSKLGFKVREEEVGRPNYSANLLLKVLLYGYFKKIRSFRKLEEVVRDHFAAAWLTGLNYPDHNTLWRFFRDNRDVIKKVFKESVRVAYRCNLLGMVVNAVDGTKVAADVSKDRAIHREDLEEILKHLEEVADEIFGEMEAAESGHEDGMDYRLSDELKDPAKLRRFIKENLRGVYKEEVKDLSELKRFAEDSLKKLDEEGRSHLSLTDGDARMIKSNGKVEFAYNSQVVVDDKEGMIVAADVTNKEADNHELVNMLDEVKENVGEVADYSVADAGYFSGEELKKAEDRGYNVVVSIEDKSWVDDGSELHRMRFVYDEKRDVWRCPKGEVLEYTGKVRNKEGVEYKIYKCKHFKRCKHRDKCSKGRSGRHFLVSQYHDVILKQVNKQKDPYVKRLLSKRKGIVEPVFGIIKDVLGFRRWSFRGLEKVKAQWYLICTVFNLKKMYKWWLEGLVQLA